MPDTNYTKVEKEYLQPATGLWRKYRPETAPLRFRAASAEEARRWQDAVRSRLEKVLGFQQEPQVDFAPRKIEAVDRGGYTREKWLLQVSPAAVLPFYLLLPKQGKIPPPLVIAFHGHGYGVKDIVGLWETGEERYHPKATTWILEWLSAKEDLPLPHPRFPVLANAKHSSIISIKHWGRAPPQHVPTPPCWLSTSAAA